MTRAALIPPPPASRRTDVQRSLCVGRTLATDAETSMAGFIVNVTMLIVVHSLTLFGLASSEIDVRYPSFIGATWPHGLRYVKANPRIAQYGVMRNHRRQGCTQLT
jgi:hypothetical protein